MNLHALGDSWCCREADTGLDRGWQDVVCKPAHRHGISGSTAAQWASDHNGIMSRACASISPGDIVIVSLIGNDLRHAISKRTLSPASISVACKDLIRVAKKIKMHHGKVCFLIYANPYPSLRICDLAARIIEAFILGVAAATESNVFDTSDILTAADHFDGSDYHPTRLGHQALAAAITERFLK